MTIRRCGPGDVPRILEIVNRAAEAYRGVIPEDRWSEPYMDPGELRDELEAGVRFWGVDEAHAGLGAVMGLQAVEDVELIRHAYVIPQRQRQGLGSRLLRYLMERSRRPLLVGTWAAADWAVSFYRKHGFRRMSDAHGKRLLRRYWEIPHRQVETSVVLAGPDFAPPPAPPGPGRMSEGKGEAGDENDL